VVGGYRLLTGKASMMPLWAYGSGNAASTTRARRKSPTFLQGYRSRKAPIDNIVQDGTYWVANQWARTSSRSHRYRIRGDDQYHPHHVQRPIS